MMVAGIVVSAATAGSFLTPFSEQRLAIVTSLIALGAFVIAIIALRGLESGSLAVPRPNRTSAQLGFTETLRDIWQDDQARAFSWFVLISMIAYSMQDLILEPFAGFLFGMTPAETTKLAGLQHGGILAGMLLAGLGGTLHARRYGPNLKLWIVSGCIGSAVMLAGLAIGAVVGMEWPIRTNVFALGVANGVFAVAAVGAMLGMASGGAGSGEGARMGVWGAAQAIAFGLGGLLGAVLVDQLRSAGGEDSAAFQAVFALEAGAFLLAAMVAAGTRLTRGASREAVTT
jgi:MFS transporter, BCD family, chlorophyll transporter